MTTATPFVQTPCCVSIPKLGHLSIGGPVLKIIHNGKTVHFEMHDYFGPQPVNKNYSELRRVPRWFWDSWERWDLGGRLIEDDVCVVPDWCQACGGSGMTGRRISARTMVDVVACAKCHGHKVESHPEQ